MNNFSMGNLKISYDFLSKLLDVTWDGFWGEYLVMAPRWKSYLLYKIYPHFMRLLGGNRKYIAHYIPHRDMYFSSPTKVYFCECVKWYLTALCEVIDPSNKYDYIYFDQCYRLLASTVISIILKR